MARKVKGFGYTLLFRLVDDEDFPKLYGHLWRNHEGEYDDIFKARMCVFDHRRAALEFQKRLVNLMRRKKVAGRVWIKRFHFTWDGKGGDIGAAVYERAKPISPLLVKAAKAGK